MKKIIGFVLILGIVLFLAGCAKPIKEIKNDQFIDQKVTIKGTVESTFKFGGLSGYTIVDKNGDKISVSSANLPAEGTQKRVTGTLKKMLLVGYYIEGE